MTDTIKAENKNNTKIIAHRGLSGIETENTNAAFVAAGNRSYWGIETDVHVTADGAFVLFHDDTTARVCGVDMKVEEVTLSELRELRMYDKTDKEVRSDLVIPTLDEYIRICKKYSKKAVLELKNPINEENIEKITEIIDNLGYLEDTVFISFVFHNLVILKNINSSLKAQFLTGEWSDDLPDRLASYGFDLDIYFKALTAQRVEAVHAKGLKVNVWTVDTLEDARILMDYGVDYITTNILE